MINQNLQHVKTSVVHHHRPETTETSEIEDPGTSTDTDGGRDDRRDGKRRVELEGWKGRFLFIFKILLFKNSKWNSDFSNLLIFLCTEDFMNRD